MVNKRIVVAIGLIVLSVILVVLAIVNSEPDIEETSFYETDPYTGEELFVDPAQAPESNQDETVSLRGSGELQDYISGGAFQDLRKQITDYIHTNIDPSTQEAYIENLEFQGRGGAIECSVVVREPTEQMFMIWAEAASSYRAIMYVNGEIYQPTYQLDHAEGDERI